MGTKVFFTGVALALGVDRLLGLPITISLIVMIFGLVLIWLDK